MSAISDFTGLITSEHQDQPNFVATVGASVAGLVDNINLLQSFDQYYDLDQAIGSQLDVIGIWVGVSRLVALDVTQYFSFDTAGLGFNQGIWYQVGDATSVVTKLDDTTYRTLIRAKIACNSWDGSLPGATAILDALVAADGCTVTGQSGNMSVIFNVNGTPTATTKAILQKGYVPIKPVGVSVIYNFNGEISQTDFGGDIL